MVHVRLAALAFAWGLATLPPASPATPVMPADTADAPRLLYVYDALCGWCYGFSPVVGELRRRHPELPVEVVSGGMIRGGRRGPLGEVAAYIKSAYRDVERATGVRFGAGFVEGPLETGEMYMTSEPPAALLAYVREVAPERAYDAAHALQEGIYDRGYGPGSDELAAHLAGALGLDADDVAAALTDERYARLAEGDFALTARLGIRGFPALLLVRGGEVRVVANGYAPLEAVERHLAAALRPAPASATREPGSPNP